MISKNIALKLMVGLLSMVVIFHCCVLFEIISYEKVWAGRINSIDEMRVFESISILVNVLLIVILFLKSKNIKNNESNPIVNVIIWIFVFLFALNTFGNLFAKSMLERILGTGLTFIFSVLCWIIVKKDQQQDGNQIGNSD